MCNFGRGNPEEQFCEIILNLDLWYKDVAYRFLIWSSGSPRVQWKRNHLRIFCIGHYEEQIYEIIFILEQWFQEEMLFEGDSHTNDKYVSSERAL